MTRVPEQNFQPQAGDSTNGPNKHTYIPRSDGSVVVGGVAYVPQAGIPAAPTMVVNAPGAAPVIVPTAAFPAAPVQYPSYQNNLYQYASLSSCNLFAEHNILEAS